ncbi:hypothetical protein ACP4OV_014075 [Aristida adscensionis]
MSVPSPTTSPPLKRPKVEPLDDSSDDSDGNDYSFYVPGLHRSAGNYSSRGDSFPEYSSDAPDFISEPEQPDSAKKDYRWYWQSVCAGISDPQNISEPEQPDSAEEDYRWYWQRVCTGNSEKLTMRQT